jgi:hypothetical protein
MTHIAAPPPADRLAALDWLRTVSVAAVVLHHTALVYAGANGVWGVGGGPARPLVNALDRALGLWRMPLLFLVAGAAMIVATRRLGVGAFLTLRAKRLLIPLAVGLPLLAAPQLYLEAYTHEPPGAFAAHALSALFDGGPTWYHLWFIPYLFVVTLGAAALRPALRSSAARAARGVGARALCPPARLLAAGAMAAAAVRALPARAALALDVVPGFRGADVVYFALFFAAGALVASDARILAAVVRDRRRALGAAAVCAAAVAALLAGEALGRPLLPQVMTVGGRPLTCGPWVVQLLSGSGAWAGALALLGYGGRYCTDGGPGLAYACDAAFPVYLLHEPILLAAAYARAGSGAVTLADVAGLLLVTVTASLAAYEYLIRRTALGRLAFGLPARVAARPMPSLPVGRWAARAARGRPAAAARVPRLAGR